jgi:DnaJ-class molecular chaperone
VNVTSDNDARKVIGVSPMASKEDVKKRFEVLFQTFHANGRHPFIKEEAMEVYQNLLKAHTQLKRLFM